MQYNEGGTHNNLRDFQNPTNIIAEVILICLHRNTLQQDHRNLTQGNHQASIKAKPWQQSSEDCSQILGRPGSVKS